MSTNPAVIDTGAGQARHALILAVLAIAGTTFALLQAIVVPALPDIQHALGTSSSGAAWILTANLLSTAVLTPILGRAGDILGKERVLERGHGRARRRNARLRARSVAAGDAARPSDPGRRRRDLPARVRHRARPVSTPSRRGRDRPRVVVGRYRRRPRPDRPRLHPRGPVLSLAVLAPAGGPRGHHAAHDPVRAALPDTGLGEHQLGLGGADGDRSCRPARGGERGQHVGLGLDEDRGAVRRRRAMVDGLGAARTALEPAPRRHADDGHPRPSGPRTWPRSCSASGCTRRSP